MTSRTAHDQKTLDRSYYVSPDVYGRETEQIFRQRWLYAGRISEYCSRE